ncbi:MAG: zinc-binding dehydrogenase family protein, partial [Proteobacteria bacterium]|nr:zinc-binding dehydrogenase family protein [Pseudomonadota bacterium]
MKRLVDSESGGMGLGEAIAIIGIGCRFPGGSDSPRTFWKLLAEGGDGIVDVPEDRWSIDRFWDPDPDKPGKMYIRAGGFIQQRIDQFDALFFGMSPREAEYLDPQQRILLEVAWEAFEDAGLPAERLAGSDTGVYVGGFMFDNMLTQLSPLNRALIGTHTAVSSTLSILANRLSYVFDLRGPNIAMDTACSSSLVALHQACQALRRNECTLALAGGVNIMYRPENPISMCKGGFLAKDGRCKSFDARADGYGRGEGAGIVVLKPLAAALRDEDDIYAIIRGTGVNQDGRTNGITVPNPESQESLVRRVCRESGVDPRDIRYFEAHGTGTAVGDPLEARALGAVVGRERDPDDPCIIGSVKANIGHLEAASGVAGVIKAALCLKHRQIPPIANLQMPNPAIPFEELGLRLPKGLESMPKGVGPALAGVNSFGYGGTNAHAILEEAPATAPFSSAEDEGPWVLPISARSPKALRALAGAYRERVAADESLKLRDLCHSAGVRRGHHDLRCAVVANSRDELLERLAAVAAGTPVQGVAQGDCAAKGQKPVFVFTGMGPQWWAMGRELYESDAQFRRTALAVDEVFRKVAGWSILDEMLVEESASRMSETHIAQPANFVIQAGLAAMWQARGIEPAAVVGHSVGEVTAAYVSGVLSLEDAVKVSFHRSRIQHKAAGFGTMLAVGVGASEASALLEGYGDQVSIAAANSPAATTLAGDRDALEAIAADLERQGVFNRFLRVEMAYHSAYMDRLRPELLSTLADLSPKVPDLPLYSTVTGRAVKGIACDAEYWCRNVREPVYFAKAIDALLADGYRLFVEVGPHPVLSTSIKECARAAGVAGLTVASLRRGEPERPQFLTALGELYSAGSPLDWRRQFQEGGRFVKLPTYPWQRETYWHESVASVADRLGRSTHPLLGFRMDGPEEAWSQALNANYLPYLQDHRVDGLVVLPGAAYVELGFAVRAEAGFGEAGAIEDLRFAKALVIDEREEPELRTAYHAESREYRVYSRTDAGGPWALHASGRLSRLSLAGRSSLDLDAIMGRLGEHMDGAAHYRNMQARGLGYGPWFEGVRDLWRDGEALEVLAYVERKEAVGDEEPAEMIDPTLLDACFQTLLALLDGGDRRVYVPVAIRRVVAWQRLGSRIWCHGRRTGGGSDMVEGDLQLCDDAGNVLAELRGVRAQALNRAEDGVEANLDQWFYEYGWAQSEIQSGDTIPAGRWLLLLDGHGVGEQAAQALRASGAEVLTVYQGDRFAVLDDGSFRVRPGERAEMAQLLQAVDPASLSGIAYLWGLNADGSSDPVGMETVAGALSLIQALAEVHAHRPPPLFLITRGAQPVLPGETATVLSAAPLVGLLRVAINEYPEQSFRAIDLESSVAGLPLRELCAVDGEEEIAYREGMRYVRRLNRKPGSELAALSDLGVQRSAPEPEAGEAEVVVRGCALTQAEARRLIHSTDPADLFVTGMVAAGESPAPGTPVFTVYRGEPARSLIAPASALVPLAPMADEALGSFASQVFPFVTAHYALRHLARAGAGERVLIHAAETGPGRAALQVALALGAEVFATVLDSAAGLDGLDAVRVIDGRALDFAERVLELTGGQGVDVAIGAFEGE